jgi:hypothetical protein
LYGNNKKGIKKIIKKIELLINWAEKLDIHMQRDAL